MKEIANIKFNRNSLDWTPETRFLLSFVHNGFHYQSGHASIADCEREAARFGLKCVIK